MELIVRNEPNVEHATSLYKLYLYSEKHNVCGVIRQLAIQYVQTAAIGLTKLMQRPSYLSLTLGETTS